MTSSRDKGGWAWVRGVVLALGLALAVGPMTARAAPESLRLLPASDTTTSAPASPLRALALEWAVGAGAAVVVVPATLALSTWVGSLSSNLVVAAAPALVLLVALPPLAVAGAEVLLGRALGLGTPRLQPAVWVALGVHVLAVVGAVLLGASTHDLGDAALFTLVEALLLPTAVTLTLHVTAPVPPDMALRAPERPRPLVDAMASRTLVVPLLRHTF